jgi:DNA-directed RNA polymerase specialized sigma subunit
MQMEKKSKVQAFLERVEMIDTIIENKLIEQRQWKDLALSITANMGGEKVQASGSQSKMADAVINCIAMEDEIVDAVDELITEKKKVVQTIEKLYSPMEYKILHMRYIQHISLTDIADKLSREYSWVTTTHGRALKNVQKLIEKKSSH